jgi:CarD family transcriptional regulator
MLEKASRTKNKKPNVSKKKFLQGDMAVYPAHGVGCIEAIENREINGNTLKFYMMKIVENGMVIMIPTSNVESVGLRELISSTEIPELYEVMKGKRQETEYAHNWNRRYKEYVDKIKSGSIYDVAEVFRDLFQLKLEKDLSFGERKLLDTVQNLLVQEISLVKAVDEEFVRQEIEGLFA